MKKKKLRISFKDSLGKGVFDVEVIRHFSNIVLGDCVEIKIQHDQDEEMCFFETYDPNRFPEALYADLEEIGWDYVKSEIETQLELR